MYTLEVHRHPTEAGIGEVNMCNRKTTRISTSAHKVSKESDSQYVNKQTEIASTIFSDDYVLLSQNTIISSAYLRIILVLAFIICTRVKHTVIQIPMHYTNSAEQYS
jgi:hypothetical protein